jgi:acetoin utilization deacetylase AcuC-like enzyme
VLHPWLAKFRPELMLVSAGFDGLWSDPLTTLGFSTTGYFHLAQRLLALADEFCHSRVVYVLEGGYDTQRLADNVAATLRAMAGEATAPDPGGLSPYPEPDISGRLAHLQSLHSL